MASITQLALRILEEQQQAAHAAEEKQAALAAEQKRIASSLARSAAQRKRHALARSLAKAEAAAKEQAERELARIAAERTLAEEQALAQQAADARALQAELARLRARSEMDILRDEVAQVRAEQMALLKACHLAHVPLQGIHLRADGELDMRFKSSKEELATARGEIAELKGLLDALIGTVAREHGVCIPDNQDWSSSQRLKKYILAQENSRSRPCNSLGQSGWLN